MDSSSDSTVSKCPGTKFPGTVWVSSYTFLQLCRCCGGIGLFFIGFFFFLGAALFLFPNIVLPLFSVNLCDWEIYPPATKLKGLQRWVKFHAYSLKQFNLQCVKWGGTVSGQKLLLNPLRCQKPCGKGRSLGVPDPRR